MSCPAAGRRIAVVGGGWAGIAAAVDAVDAGFEVALFEMAPALGGRARQLDPPGGSPQPPLDNGQHILIGAYRETLQLLQRVGIEPREAFLRLPLALRYPDGGGIELRPGPAAPAFARAVLGRRGWRFADRLALLAAAGGWALRGFDCPASWTVARLVRRLPAPVRIDLIEPLCVAALNTPADQASASIFLRVLREALFGGPGAADLLLPRLRLGELLPQPATRWLAAAGVPVRLRHRVRQLGPAADGGWLVDGEPFGAVVLATSAGEAARLVEPMAPGWARQAGALEHEPIVTVYLQAATARLAAPMLLLRGGSSGPAQFVFDLGQLGGRDGLLAFVISGARPWVDAGSQATLEAVAQQARTELGLDRLETVQLVAEKRATFRSTPGLQRPRAGVAAGLLAAGDYVEGPYPATLEGAVRSGQAAVRALAGAGASQDARPRRPST